MVICGQLSLMLLLWLTEDSDDGQHFLVVKYFLIKVYVHCFLRHNAIAQLIDYSIV